MNTTTFTIISLNIEGHQHTQQVLTFLQQENPDVLCLQELYADEFPRFKQELDMNGVYTPRVKVKNKLVGDGTISGNAILSRFPITHTEDISYEVAWEHPERLRYILEGPPDSRLLVATLQAETAFQIATTHFTWTPDGQANEAQRQNLPALTQLIKKYPSLLLCGDFNAPRGREIFDELAQVLKDNIPSEITSTLDPNLHKAGRLDLVVDGLFTTPNYEVLKVEVIEGISDHCAIKAEIKVSPNP